MFQWCGSTGYNAWENCLHEVCSRAWPPMLGRERGGERGNEWNYSEIPVRSCQLYTGYCVLVGTSQDMGQVWCGWLCGKYTDTIPATQHHVITFGTWLESDELLLGWRACVKLLGVAILLSLHCAYAGLQVTTHVLYTAPLPWVCELGLLLELLNNKDSLMVLATCPITRNSSYIDTLVEDLGVKY